MALPYDYVRRYLTSRLSFESTTPVFTDIPGTTYDSHTRSLDIPITADQAEILRSHGLIFWRQVQPPTVHEVDGYGWSDATAVTADDYDDPDSMINRIDYALALHQGGTDE